MKRKLNSIFLMLLPLVTIYFIIISNCYGSLDLQVGILIYTVLVIPFLLFVGGDIFVNLKKTFTVINGVYTSLIILFSYLHLDAFDYIPVLILGSFLLLFLILDYTKNSKLIVLNFMSILFLFCFLLFTIYLHILL